MNSEPIRPALTPEEWEEAFRRWDDYDGRGAGVYSLDEWNKFKRDALVGRAGDLGDHHEAAALALYRQPFGFTWEDVDALRAQIEADVRRAERLIVTLGASEGDLNPEALKYINRLSDHLFVAARHVAAQGSGDVLWKPGASR